jgi:hypothetical protein
MREETDVEAESASAKLEAAVRQAIAKVVGIAETGDRICVGDTCYEVRHITWPIDDGPEPHPDGAITLLRNGTVLVDARPDDLRDDGPLLLPHA